MYTAAMRAHLATPTQPVSQGAGVGIMATHRAMNRYGIMYTVQQTKHGVKRYGQATYIQAPGQCPQVLGYNPTRMKSHAQHGQDGCGGKAQPHPFQWLAVLELPVGQGEHKAAEAHHGAVAFPELQRSGQIGQEVGAHKRAAVPHGHDGEVDKADDKPQCGQYPGLFAAQQVGHGAEKVHPANLAQDAPPETFEMRSVRCAVNQCQHQQQHAAQEFEPAGRLPVLGILVPQQEEARYHEEDPQRPVPVHGACFLVADECAHDKQRQRPAEDMQHGAFRTESFGNPAFKGIRDGHAHGKKEHGKDDV